MFRITTRADFDGLVSAALLSVVEEVDRFRFIEPGPFQHGELEVTNEDIISNLSYREGCAMWFDHHISNRVEHSFRGSWWVAPSAARVIFEYYGNGDLSEYDELVNITDRIDGAMLTEAELRDPKDYILIAMTIDGRIPADEPYWMRLIDLLRANDHKQLLRDAEVRERCDAYREMNAEWGEALGLYSDLDSNVLVTDFRNRWRGEHGNRFLAFTLFPECDIWVKIFDVSGSPNITQISVGHSIFKRTATVNVAEMMKKYGGGGHQGAGGCRIPKSKADKIFKEIIETCKHD